MDDAAGTVGKEPKGPDDYKNNSYEIQDIAHILIF